MLWVDLDRVIPECNLKLMIHLQIPSRGTLAAAELNGKLYAIGGTYLPGMTPLDTVEIYTPSTTTGVIGENNSLPMEYNLSQNYPNPFNPTTVINYSVPEATFVTIKVYDLLGREVKTLVNEDKVAGNYSMQFNGSNLASGIYFYRMEADPSTGSGQGFMQTKKLVLLK